MNHIIRILKIFTTLILLFIGFSAYKIWSYSNKDQLIKTDAAIVLGAAAWGVEPSPVLRERINHAIWLYENHYVEKIIFTGGKIDENDLTESEVSKIYALEHNVNENDILIERESNTTEENLQFANKLAQEHNLRTFTIVSDPLHMKRAMIIADQVGLNAYSSPTTTSAYQSFKTKFPFFFRELIYYMGYLLSIPFNC